MIRPHSSRHKRLLTLALALLLSISAHSWTTTALAQNGVGSGPPLTDGMSMSKGRASGSGHGNRLGTAALELAHTGRSQTIAGIQGSGRHVIAPMDDEIAIGHPR